MLHDERERLLAIRSDLPRSATLTRWVGPSVCSATATETISCATSDSRRCDFASICFAWATITVVARLASAAATAERITGDWHCTFVDGSGL